MDFTAFSDPPQLYFVTFLFSFVSGFVPVVNAEAYLLSVAALAGVPALPMALASAGGQVTAKYLLFLSGRGALRLRVARDRPGLQRLQEKMERRHGRAETLIFVSALTGIPPLYMVSVAAGLLRLPLAGFLAAAYAGRFLRFGAILLFPQLVARLLAWI